MMHSLPRRLQREHGPDPPVVPSSHLILIRWQLSHARGLLQEVIPDSCSGPRELEGIWAVIHAFENMIGYVFP
jgi:hypothetical protein